MNHEPEDLLREIDRCSLEAGERVRMKKRVQSSGSIQALGIFSFEAMATISFGHGGLALGCAGSASSAGGRMRARGLY
jgi:hypothetical protein